LADSDEIQYQNKPFVLTVGNAGQMLQLIGYLQNRVGNHAL